MEVSVNYLAVFLAAVSSMFVGALWYSPAGFFKQWQKLAGIKYDPMKASQGKMGLLYGSVFIASLVMAYVLAHVTFLSNHFFKHSFLQDALATAFWLWVGFTAARLYVHDAFEGRRKKLTLLNSLHELVTALVMALIIGVMGI